MRTKIMGTATDQGSSGVDVYLSKYWKLPDYYVTKEAAKSAGWVSWKGRVTVDIRTRCHLFFSALFAPDALARYYLASLIKHKNHTKITA